MTNEKPEPVRPNLENLVLKGDISADLAKQVNAYVAAVVAAKDAEITKLRERVAELEGELARFQEEFPKKMQESFSEGFRDAKKQYEA